MVLRTSSWVSSGMVKLVARPPLHTHARLAPVRADSWGIGPTHAAEGAAEADATCTCCHMRVRAAIVQRQAGLCCVLCSHVPRWWGQASVAAHVKLTPAVDSVCARYARTSGKAPVTPGLLSIFISCSRLGSEFEG